MSIAFQVQDAMIESVRHVIHQSVKACIELSRNDWIMTCPGQGVLCAAHVIWTSAITEAISKGLPTLKKYHSDIQVTSYLSQIVS